VDELQIRVEDPTFNGDVDMKEFLDWIDECDRVRKYTSITEKKIMKLVAYNLKG